VGVSSRFWGFPNLKCSRKIGDRIECFHVILHSGMFELTFLNASIEKLFLPSDNDCATFSYLIFVNKNSLVCVYFGFLHKNAFKRIFFSKMCFKNEVLITKILSKNVRTFDYDENDF